jgi:hypothetical protein
MGHLPKEYVCFPEGKILKKVIKSYQEKLGILKL